jgi:hypothetical protein
MTWEILSTIVRYIGRALATSRERNISFGCTWDIDIRSAHHGELVRAVAVLDTGCCYGNWISQDLTSLLGVPIQPVKDPPIFIAANGQLFEPQGEVSIRFKRDKGCRYYDCMLYVLPPAAQHFDLIFGYEYIVEKKIIQ